MEVLEPQVSTPALKFTQSLRLRPLLLPISSYKLSPRVIPCCHIPVPIEGESPRPHHGSPALSPRGPVTEVDRV